MGHTFLGYPSVKKTALLASFMLLCLSLIGSICANADAPSSSDTIASRPGYATTILDITAQKLPAAYQGNDPIPTFVNLVRNIEATKGEFETTQQFNDRIAKGKASPIVGSLMLDSTFAFQVDPSCVSATYDADKSQMTVNLSFVQCMGDFYNGDVNGLQLTSLETNKQIYTATNGFGAEFQVAKATDNTVNLLITNRKNFHMKWNDHKSGFSTDFVVPMAVDIAQVAKPNMAVLAICHLVQIKGHYASTNHDHRTPTTDIPFDLDMTDDFMAIKLDQLWIYNSVTGDIYQRVLPQSKK